MSHVHPSICNRRYWAITPKISLKIKRDSSYAVNTGYRAATCFESDTFYVQRPSDRNIEPSYVTFLTKITTMMEIPSLPSDRQFVSPRDYDVKCGRGKDCFQNPGNSLLRLRVATRLHEYEKNNINQASKAKVVDSVITEFFAEGTRFLKRDPSAKLWYDGGINAARERVGSAFRDASKPNKVKCMEKLKIHFSNNNEAAEIFNHTPTVNNMLSDSQSCLASSAGSTVDEFTASQHTPLFALLESSSTQNMEPVETMWRHSVFLAQRHDGTCYDALLPPKHDRINKSANSVFQSQQYTGCDSEASSYESPESNSTINVQDAKSVFNDIGSDGDTYSTTMMEDIDDINQDLPLSKEDKAFLLALDWDTINHDPDDPADPSRRESFESFTAPRTSLG